MFNNYTPDQNDGHHVFCFGSNLKGIHGAGAALAAARHWGAKRGVGEGPTGRAYALPTKETPYKSRSLLAIEASVKTFLDYARQAPNVTFLVTRVGCGFAGYEDRQIAPMFKDAPENCVLPEGWGRAQREGVSL